MILHSLHSLLICMKRPSESPPWIDETIKAFGKAKQTLADITLHVHSVANRSTGVMTDVSDVAVDTVLQQYVNEQWCPLSAYMRLVSVTSLYVWPNINHDIREWARSCLQSQRSKVHHHIANPLGTFATPDAGFLRVHIDLVRPLPPSFTS